MNLLTVRRLPIFTERSGSEHKVRMDRALAEMVTASVQMRYPSMRVGKRYSIEFALLSWLHAEGLIAEEPKVPVAGATEGNGGNT